MPPAIQTSWGKVRAVQGDPKKIRWEPENGDAATETLGLWLQPGSHRARLMTMHLLCGDVEQAVIIEITDVETATWNTMMLKLQPDEEKDVVQDIAPKAGARLMGIRSKYSLLDATVEVVRRVSDKGLLTTWSAGIIMKDAEARAMWNMAWPKMYRDLDARSEPGDEGDHPSTAKQQEERPRGDTDQTEMKKVLALLESLHDLNIPEEDRLQALVAEEYEDEIDMAILLLPATGIYSAVRKRITEATQSEVKWWAKVLVKYVRYVRRDRVEEEDKARAQRAKEAEHAKQQDRDRAQARKWSPKKSSTPTERSRKYAKNNQGAAQRVILPDDTNKTDGDEDVEDQAEEVQDNQRPPAKEDTSHGSAAADTPTGVWKTGEGVNKVVVQRLTRGAKRLRPVLLTGFQYTDAMDSYSAAEEVFGMLSLDFRTFRDMQRQYNEVVMFVPGEQLDTALSGAYRDSFRVSAARDPMQRSDEIEIKELSMLDGLKKIAARIPSPQQTKPEAAVEVAATGVVVDALTDQTVWCLMPPYSPQHAFISLWGFGQCTEMGGTVTFTAGMEDAQRDIAEIAERHGIWGIQKSFQKRPEGSQNERHSLNSTESEWDKAADQFEVVVRSRGHGMQDAPPWVLQQLTQSKAYKGLNKQNKKHKTGGYHPVQTMACPTEDSGTLTLAGERVQPPTRRTGSHSEVLRQGDQRVAGHRSSARNHSATSESGGTAPQISGVQNPRSGICHSVCSGGIRDEGGPAQQTTGRLASRNQLQNSSRSSEKTKKSSQTHGPPHMVDPHLSNKATSRYSGGTTGAISRRHRSSRMDQESTGCVGRRRWRRKRSDYTRSAKQRIPGERGVLVSGWQCVGMDRVQNG